MTYTQSAIRAAHWRAQGYPSRQAYIESIKAKRKERYQRRLDECRHRPVTVLDRLRASLHTPDEAPRISYSGDTAWRWHVGSRRAWRAWIETSRGDRYSSRCIYTKTNATVHVAVSVRLAALHQLDGVPLAVSGVVHLDAQRTGARRLRCYRVVAASPRKGMRAADTGHHTYLARYGRDTWAHGDTPQDARANAREQALSTRREQALAAKGQRISRIVRRILDRGRAPACWDRWTVRDEDRQRAGLCRIGTEAWLLRHRMRRDVRELPLGLVARFGQDQGGLVARILEQSILRKTT